MNRPIRRRDFLKHSGGLATGLWVIGSHARGAGLPAAERLNIGVIGVRGRGEANLQAVADAGENIVALCDVDARNLAAAAAQHPGAKTYADFRQMLEQPGLDAVIVSTPDHCHAAATVDALRRKLHVYCEKPLTHAVAEARAVAAAAADAQVATQMGNGGHSSETTRRIVEIVQSGALGTIQAVHCWTNRPIWPQGIAARPAPQPVPEGLAWDLWIGPAPERPYNEAYHPFKWRGWWDFGTGALGDMGCHIIDPAFWALDMRDPEAVSAESSPVSAETAPAWSIVRWAFPARGDRPALELTWSDGGKFPPAEFFEGRLPQEGSSGSLFVGTKGRLAYGVGKDREQNRIVLLPEKDFDGFRAPAPTLTRSPGHHPEWLAACKAGTPTGTPFATYAAALTETVLLGNVTLRAGQPIRRDGDAWRLADGASTDLLLGRPYRAGWSL